MKGMGIINTFRVAQSDPKHIPKGQRSAISDGIVKSTKVILNQDQALTWKSTELQLQITELKNKKNSQILINEAVLKKIGGKQHENLC